MADLGKLLARAAPILARVAVDRPAKLVEIGVFAGDLAAHLLVLRPFLVYHGVDNWLPREEQPLAYRATGDTHAMATASQQANWEAEARQRLARFSDRAHIIKDESPNAASAFEAASVDLVFIDADHSREGTYADLQAWWPIVKPGGWLSGHDFNNPDPRFKYGVTSAVDQFSNEIMVTYELDDGFTYWMRKPVPLP